MEAIMQPVMSLQSTGRNRYHKARSFLLRPDTSNAMDHPTDRTDSSVQRRKTGGPSEVNSTHELVTRAKAGDAAAIEQLFARHLPPLKRWASGRLPRRSRDFMDTDDLVQDTVIKAVRRLDSFEPRHPGALQAYLRQAVLNRIRDEGRRAGHLPQVAELEDRHADRGASPLELAIGREAVERYEAALARLRPEEREAVIARVEMDRSFAEIAQDLGKPSPDAARMAVSRALLRLAEEMNRGA
jgi:RNA polymerase sigma-70 factor (ECF subfamily)